MTTTHIALTPQAVIVSRENRKTVVKVRALTKAEIKRVRSNSVRRLKEAKGHNRTHQCSAREELDLDIKHFLERPYIIADQIGTMEFMLATARLEGAMIYAKRIEAEQKA